MNEKTILYQITETSKFMMSFVLITKNDNAIVIDGGRKEDMPLLKKYIGGRHISAWILTHGHFDHISGFASEFKRNGLADFDIEKVYCHFPPYYELVGKTDVPWKEYFDRERAELWIAKNWKKSDGKPVLNPELWQSLWNEIQKHEYKIVWVKGHAGHPENERCDILATTQAAKYS